MDTHNANSQPVLASDANAELAPAGTPTFDLDRYRPRVRDRFVSDEDADAFLTAVGKIMIMVVDLRLSEKDSTAVLSFLNDFPSEEPEEAVQSKGQLE